MSDQDPERARAPDDVRTDEPPNPGELLDQERWDTPSGEAFFRVFMVDDRRFPDTWLVHVEANPDGMSVQLLDESGESQGIWWSDAPPDAFQLIYRGP